MAAPFEQFPHQAVQPLEHFDGDPARAVARIAEVLRPSLLQYDLVLVDEGHRVGVPAGMIADGSSLFDTPGGQGPATVLRTSPAEALRMRIMDAARGPLVIGEESPMVVDPGTPPEESPFAYGTRTVAQADAYNPFAGVQLERQPWDPALDLVEEEVRDLTESPVYLPDAERPVIDGYDDEERR